MFVDGASDEWMLINKRIIYGKFSLRQTFLILIVNVRCHDVKVTISFQRLPTHETCMLLKHIANVIHLATERI